MKAYELIALLNRDPGADVRIIVTGDGVPPLLEPQHIAMNNEANSWIINPPVPPAPPGGRGYCGEG